MGPPISFDNFSSPKRYDPNFIIVKQTTYMYVVTCSIVYERDRLIRRKSRQKKILPIFKIIITLFYIGKIQKKGLFRENKGESPPLF